MHLSYTFLINLLYISPFLDTFVFVTPVNPVSTSSNSHLSFDDSKIKGKQSSKNSTISSPSNSFNLEFISLSITIKNGYIP
jgi:hypothetical protein